MAGESKGYEDYGAEIVVKIVDGVDVFDDGVLVARGRYSCYSTEPGLDLDLAHVRQRRTLVLNESLGLILVQLG